MLVRSLFIAHACKADSNLQALEVDNDLELAVYAVLASSEISKLTQCSQACMMSLDSRLGASDPVLERMVWLVWQRAKRLKLYLSESFLFHAALMHAESLGSQVYGRSVIVSPISGGCIPFTSWVEFVNRI